jgi:hypothetical protein
MHYSMADREQLGLAAICKKPSDACDRVSRGFEIRQFGNQHRTVSVFRPELALAAAGRFHLTGEQHLRDGWLNPVKPELERRRPTVQGKHH